MRRFTVRRLLATVVLVLLAGNSAGSAPDKNTRSGRIHYMEIVSRDVAAQCSALERVHGFSFGSAVKEAEAIQIGLWQE